MGTVLSTMEQRMKRVRGLRRELEGIIRKKQELFGTDTGGETDLSLRGNQLVNARAALEWAKEMLQVGGNALTLATVHKAIHGTTLERHLDDCEAHLMATIAVMDAVEALTLLPEASSIRFIGNGLVRWCSQNTCLADTGIVISGCAIGAAVGTVVSIAASPVIGVPVGIVVGLVSTTIMLYIRRRAVNNAHMEEVSIDKAQFEAMAVELQRLLVEETGRGQLPPREHELFAAAPGEVRALDSNEIVDQQGRVLRGPLADIRRFKHHARELAGTTCSVCYEELTEAKGRAEPVYRYSQCHQKCSVRLCHECHDGSPALQTRCIVCDIMGPVECV